MEVDKLGAMLKRHRLTDKLSVLIISGRSGSGKTSVLNALEDLGYYSIDNLPLSLVPEAAHKLVNESNIKRVALGVDIRSPQLICRTLQDSAAAT